MSSRLALRESIADLWGYPDARAPKRPRTEDLFRAISKEALDCLKHADWDDRIRRIENILSVIKSRVRRHWEEQHMSTLDRLIISAKREADARVKGQD